MLCIWRQCVSPKLIRFRIPKLKQETDRFDSLTDSQQEALEMVVSEAEHMTQILQNLLDLARASHSMMPLQPELGTSK